jgi:NADH dehydrogenase [ubiquinone] 1 alpha subcomplex assembly factor 1
MIPVVMSVIVGALVGCSSAESERTVAISDSTSVAALPSSTSPRTTESATSTAQVPASSTSVAAKAATPPTTPTTNSAFKVFDFAAAEQAEGWSVINDTVMGGVSSGDLSWENGALVFSGFLSLENNGGFASIRSPQIDTQLALNWSTSNGIRVLADGDGRTWTLQLRTTDDVDGGWTQSFATTANATTDVMLPWQSFEPVTRFLEARSTDISLDPSRISTIAFYLVDGIQQPFRIAIRSIS